MIRRLLTLIGLSILAPMALAQDSYDPAPYATCAACHLPDGNGVPGAFPPIRDRVAKIAALDGGREYLVTVVAYGLMGTIDVAGVQYFGVMAGNAGPMTAADIAAALNYIVFELNDGDASSIEPFTAEEVEATQAATTMKSPAGGGQLRTELVGTHGAEWP
ncbi:MAG: c-type cytochrome [Woeseiaceae bacterium]